jgi:uncharacterized protein (TIGR02270 family)
MSASENRDFFSDVVEESFEESTFLWRRWEQFLDGHEHNLDEIVFWLEDRLRGALNGVIVAGDAAIDSLLEPALSSDSNAQVAVAAFCLSRLRSPQATDALTRALASLPRPALTGVIRGIEVGGDDDLVREFAAMLQTGEAGAKAAILDLHSTRGLDVGPILREFLRAEEPEVRAAAARAARHGDAQVMAPALSWLLKDHNAPVLAAAAESGLYFSVPGAWTTLLSMDVDELVLSGPRPLYALAASGASDGSDRLMSLVDAKPHRRNAVFALGISGRRNDAELCLEILSSTVDPRLLRVAAESFCTITGLDLEVDGFVLSEAELPPPDLKDDDLDADLVPTCDDDLPLPDVAGVIRWWNQHRDRFGEGLRFHRGQPVTASGLWTSLKEGRARRREAIAFELALRSRGALRVNTRVFAAEQHRQMSTFATLPGGIWARSVVPGSER